MKRHVLIETAPLPRGGALGLYQDGEDMVIRIEGGPGAPLMSTRMHGSEDGLGRIPCERVAARSKARVLVGGLGMGFTLRAALDALRADARVVVAELVPGVVTWNEGVLGAHAGWPVRDPRAEVRVVDVAKVLKAEPLSFDAILLDVDNGPDGLTQERNDWLYTRAGLDVAHQALRPSGVLAIWSAGADDRFAARVRKAGFVVEDIKVFAHGNRGTRHTLWIATKQAARGPHPAR